MKPLSYFSNHSYFDLKSSFKNKLSKITKKTIIAMLKNRYLNRYKSLTSTKQQELHHLHKALTIKPLLTKVP